MNRTPKSAPFLVSALTFLVAACNWSQSASPTSVGPSPTTGKLVPIFTGVPTATPAPAPAAAPVPVPAPTATPTPAPRAPDPDDDEKACPTPNQIRIKVHLPNGPKGWVMDSVALTCNPEACASFKGSDGKPRQCCPLGPEGSDRRIECEEEMVPEGPSWQVQGSHLKHPDNPWLHFVKPPANVRACLPQGACSDWLRVSGN